MYSDAGNTPSRVLGFPIRTPSDHSSFGSSPRLIAAYYVLHRLLVPRHPPCALTHLHSQTIKDARVHCAVLKQHTPTPPTHHENDASRESVPSETTDAVSDTQQCVSSRTTTPPPAAGPEPTTQQDHCSPLRDSVPPNEPPGVPHSDTEPGANSDTTNRRCECSLERR